MIKVGTVCVITYTNPPSKYIGRFCTVVERIPVDKFGHDNKVDIGGFITRGADKCLMPISDGNEKTRSATNKALEAA